MAQVPELTGPQVNPTQQGTPTQHVETSPFMFGGGLAEGLSGVGSELEQGGQMLAQHAMAFQEIDNRTNADQAQADYVLNHLAPTSADFYQKKGQDAIDAYKPTLDNLEEQRAAISASLPNQPTRLLYDQQTRSILSYEARTMSYHVAQERNTWQNQAAEGQVTAATNMAVLHSNDPTVLAASELGIKEAYQHNGALQGEPPDYVNAKIAQATSTMYSKVAIAKNNFNSRDAMDFYRAHYDKFDAVDADQIGRMLKASTGVDDAMDLVHHIVGGQGTANIDQLVPLVQQQEIGRGHVLISPKGAIGVMQIMPDTAVQVAKELGLPFDPEKLLKDPDYNRALGTQYLKDLNQQFHGDQALILAAYNAGPGAVQDWIDGTNKSGKNPNLLHLSNPFEGGTDEAFAAQIPFPETKNYVAKITEKTGGFPKGNPPTLDSIDKMYSTWQQQLDEAIGTGPHAGDEMYKYAAEKKLEGYVASVQKGLRDQQLSAFHTLDQLVTGNPALGQKGLETQDQLFAQPGAKEQFALLSVPQQKTIISQINENTAGPKAVTTPMLEKYHALLGEFRNDPNAFNKEDIAGMSDLTSGMRRELIDRQASPEKHTDEHIGEAMGVVSGQLAAAGITKSGDIESYNKFTGAMMDKLDEFIAGHNRRPNDSDIMKMGQQLLQRDNPSGFFKGGYGFEHPGGQIYRLNGAPIPDEDVQQIRDFHMRRFGTVPSEGQIDYWYSQKLRGQRGGR